MTRCDCLRYLALIAGRKNTSIYIFSDDDGELIPVESVYPLEGFETGTGALKCICPYYNFVQKGRLIRRAFKRRLGEKDKALIAEAVKNCKYAVSVKKHLVFSERHAEIFNSFIEKYNLKTTWRLLKHFINFLKVRSKYKDNGLCKDVPPAEKKQCFDELWLESFKSYLEDVNFEINR